MKKIFKSGFVLMVIAIVLSAGINNTVKAQSAVTASVTYQNFYDDLSPYGTWIDYPGYGNVWHPMVDGDFRPYLTNGNWDYSNDGWLWSSNYSWGWAPFHYGRWVYDSFYGWLWIPGYEWSPAWVTWGYVDNFYAWAPLLPEVNVGIHFNTWRPNSLYWNLCSRDHILDRDIYNRVENRNTAVNYINRINVYDNFKKTREHNQYYAKGPEAKDVEKYVNHKIEPVSIRDVNKASDGKHDGNNSQVYRPMVSNPQPREFRRIPDNQVNPVRNNEDHANTAPAQQHENANKAADENNSQVPRPVANNPQPGETRRTPDNQQANPVRNNEEHFNIAPAQQRENVNRLPVNRAPQSSFRAASRQSNNGGGQRGRKN